MKKKMKRCYRFMDPSVISDMKQYQHIYGCSTCGCCMSYLYFTTSGMLYWPISIHNHFRLI